jgi:hypothetical protein
MLCKVFSNLCGSLYQHVFPVVPNFFLLRLGFLGSSHFFVWFSTLVAVFLCVDPFLTFCKVYRGEHMLTTLLSQAYYVVGRPRPALNQEMRSPEQFPCSS